MANIQNWLTKIKSAIYGREMRQALHDSIKAVNDELVSTTSRVKVTEDGLEAEVQNRQSADNALRRDLNTETTNRQNADSALQQTINKEIGDRQNACSELQQALDEEIDNREAANDVLQRNIGTEAVARQTTDEALRTDVTELRELSHTHDNKSVLDEITEERLTSWDSMGSNGVYIMELIGGLMTDVASLQKALGIVVCDGGLFEQDYDSDDFDGGDFDSEPSSVFDCGGFETTADNIKN